MTEYDDFDPDEIDDAPELAPDDAGDRKRVERKAQRVAREEREADQFWRDALSTQIGRRELWRVLSAAHCFDERFACGPNGFPQPEATWFEAGKQAFAQRLYKRWEIVDFMNVYLMRCENDLDFAAAPRPQERIV